MAEDIQKPKGPTKRGSPTRGGANPRLAPVLGIVKDNVDPTRSGRIMVYISDNSGTDPDNKDNWRPVKFLSPFFGFTRPDAPNDGLGTYKGNPSSYGMWMAPPDIGTTVVCIFIDGDMNYGFYIGCVPEPEMMQMVPAIGATDNIVPNAGEAKSYGGAKRLPVTNINTNNKAVADSKDYLTAPKPIHSYTATIMNQQGVINDPVRGPISSSSQRETPSRVGWGVSTPGRPIYEGGFDDTSIADNLKRDQSKQLRVVSRRGGHTIVMDDGDIIGRDNLVRIRTSLGHQILMSDDGQTLMLLHSNGQSYVELGKEGTIDMYATNSVNIRTQGDLNLHADNEINIHATKNLNIQGENIHINSEKEFKQRTGADFSQFTTGKHTTKVSGAYSVNSGGQASMASGAEAFVNGSKVNLNSGKTSTQPAEVPAIDKVLHTDTLFDKDKGFLAAPNKLVSITSRAPAHTPWAEACKGVDVKTSLDAASSLPSSPSPAAAQTNATAASAGVSNPVQTASTAASPPTGAASPALDKNTTKAITSQVATDAANGPLANAVTKGTAIANTASGPVVGVGQYAQTPTQLEKSGVLKPGAGALVTSVAAATGNVQAAMTDNLFTGKPGAENLKSFVNNVQAQTESLVKNIQVGQTALQNAGVMTGAESGTALGGMVMSAAKNGVNNTLSAIKNSATSGVSSAVTSAVGGLSGKVSGVMKDISAGNFAAKLGEGAGGALSGLQSSLNAMSQSPSLASVMEQSKGLAAQAFSAIKGSIPDLKPGVPQNLTAIAKEQASKVLATAASGVSNITAQAEKSLSTNLASAQNLVSGLKSSDMASGVSGQLSGALSKGASVADSILSTAKQSGANLQSSLLDTTSTAFTSATSLVKGTGSLAETAKNTVTGGIGAVSASLASGINNLPGGQAAVASINNLAATATAALPGTAGIKSAIQGAATNALNGATSNLQGAAGALGAAAGKLTGAVSSLQNKAGSLTSLATKGLPAGAAAKLQSAVGSVASSGSGIKVPSVAVNTTDRSSITAAISTQLEDPKIPAPNLLGEVDEGAKSKVEEFQSTKSEYEKNTEKVNKELTSLYAKEETLIKDWQSLQAKLPQGDPAIKAAFDKVKANNKEISAKRKEYEKIQEDFIGKYPEGYNTKFA